MRSYNLRRFKQGLDGAAPGEYSSTSCIGVMGGLRGVNVNRVARSLSIVTARMGGLPDV